jgi:hypothetical protein
MTKNKGKPSRQQADERVETQGNIDPQRARAVHRLDRSRGDEKGGKGPSATKHQSAPTARQRTTSRGA